MADRVGHGLLGDAEGRQLHLRRRSAGSLPARGDVDAGQAVDSRRQPLQRRAHAEVVEQREPEVAGHLPELIGDVACQRRSLAIVSGFEPAGEEEQVLERPVVEVGREPRPLGFGDGQGEVALDGGARRGP